MWEVYKKGFKAYLQLEKSLANNSVEAYLTDIDKVTTYLQTLNDLKTPEQLTLKDLEQEIESNLLLEPSQLVVLWKKYTQC